MDSSNDIRWIQRFNNYRKTIQHLENALEDPDPDIVHKAGIIHFFEMSVELAWKMLKDYLEEQGYKDVKSPRNVIKKSFEIDIIHNGHDSVSYTHLRAHETDSYLVCR